MLKRVITGAVILALVVGFLLLREVTVYAFDGLVALLIAVSFIELRKSLKEAGYKVSVLPLVVFLFSFFGLYYFLGTEGILFSVALSAFTALAVFTFKADMKLGDLLSTVFTVVYPGVFLGSFLLINHGYLGLMGIVLVFAVSMLTDTTAYFVGVLLGKHKLCPTISPKKTVEGLVGGIIGGVLGAVLTYFVFSTLLSGAPVIARINQWLFYAVVGLVGAVINTVGDLIASRIKRESGIKDFGSVFPGHGGVLDRMDGLMCVALFIAVLTEVIV